MEVKSTTVGLYGSKTTEKAKLSCSLGGYASTQTNLSVQIKKIYPFITPAPQHPGKNLKVGHSWDKGLRANMSVAPKLRQEEKGLHWETKGAQYSGGEKMKAQGFPHTHTSPPNLSCSTAQETKSWLASHLWPSHLERVACTSTGWQGLRSWGVNHLSSVSLTLTDLGLNEWRGTVGV